MSTRLDLDGELTIVYAAEQHEQLLRFLTGGPDLELGLGGVTELDTAGLQVLLLAVREARRRGLRLRLTDLSPAVRDVLAVAWLTPDLEAA
ncbi:lipid asymmetry maintenance protein MlaB [Dactylosporangium sp. NPDC051541]|uniref:lipid asymmetry maintenance protein MlaB n=1 Tax=Dactylosporangium sp. NPDC051541 TaxID=3363977 RepID=UPI0037B2B777